MSKTISFLQAINEAMAEEMRRDPSVFVMGEDVRMGVFGQTAGLVNEFGEERILNTPISENAITGVAMGAAMNGHRPVLELMFCDFAMLAMGPDQQSTGPVALRNRKPVFNSHDPSNRSGWRFFAWRTVIPRVLNHN